MGPPPPVKPELELIFGSPADAAPLPAALVAAAGPLAEEDAGALLWQNLLAGWLEQLLPELPPERRAPHYSLGLRLTDDAGIALLNRTWRGKEGPTDVLAFAALDEAAWDGDDPLPPLPPPPWLGDDGGEEEGCGEPLELGDIVISLETAGRQAEEAGVTLERELLFLASHGLLHLLGWDHPDEASLAAMLERQERLLG